MIGLVKRAAYSIKLSVILLFIYYLREAICKEEADPKIDFIKYRSFRLFCFMLKLYICLGLRKKFSDRSDLN